MKNCTPGIPCYSRNTPKPRANAQCRRSLDIFIKDKTYMIDIQMRQMELDEHENAEEMRNDARIALWNSYEKTKNLERNNQNNYCWMAVKHAITRCAHKRQEITLSDGMKFESMEELELTDMLIDIQRFESRLSPEASAYVAQATEICPRVNQTRKPPKQKGGWRMTVLHRRMKKDYGYDMERIHKIEREIKLAAEGKARVRPNPALCYSRALQQGDYCLPCSPAFASGLMR